MIALVAALALASAPDPVEAQILDLKPAIQPRYAKSLARLSTYWAGYYQVDPRLVVAIIRVESFFVPALKACWPSPRPGEDITCDHGLGQINDIWVTQWDLDRERLLHDESYNIAIVSRLLAQLKRQFGAEPDWYGRYHSNKPAKKADYIQKLREAGFEP